MNQSPVYMQSINRKLSETAEVVRRCIETNVIPMIWGASGVGKTEMLENLISSIPDCLQITLSLGSRDPLDFTGIPSIQANRTITNDPDLVPLEGDLLPLIPETVGTPEERRYICVVVYVDELPEGDTPTLKAIYRLLNERMVNNSKVHPNVRFVASGNPISAGAQTEKLIPTVANRMMHIEVELCHKEWIGWATGKGISPVQRAFIAMNPQMLSNYDEACEEDAFATPRTHARLHDYMKGDSFSDMTLIAQGAPVQFLGKEVGCALLAYAAATDLPDMDSILRNPQDFDIDALEPGSKFLLGQSLVSVADSTNISAVLEVMGRMQDNHKAINFMSLQGLPSKRLRELMQNPVFAEFVADNINLLTIIKKVK